MRALLLAGIAALAASPLAAVAGGVAGTVRLAGPTAAPEPARITKDQGACGTEAPDESLLVAGGGLANAVVRLEGAPAEAPRKLVLDQQRCRFVPRVLVAPAGSTLEVTNGDAVLHSAHGWRGPRTAFSVQTPGKGDREAVPLARAGVVRVACDVHAWMAAFVHVVDGPAAVTDGRGAFRLTAPPGSYTAHVWHERLGERSFAVTVPAAGEARLDVELRASSHDSGPATPRPGRTD